MRVQGGAYPWAAAVLCFAAAFLLYLGYESWALMTVIGALVAFPVLAFRDRVEFDGKRLCRTGILWQLFRLVTRQPRRIRPSRVFHVDTRALRALRRGPNVTYLYRTLFISKDLSFTVGSGRGYRAFIEKVLPLIDEESIDLRSLELRDHFVAASVAISRAKNLKIPRSDVLDPSSLIRKADRAQTATHSTPSDDSVERADQLRKVANELRANGRLVQSVEAFRRALRLAPRNGRLIYEFARCIQSLAAANRDARLGRKAAAMLRLAERRSNGDSTLLAHLGETYLTSGDWRRAERVYRRAVETGKAGYRIFRGLGELALRDGKIAHAINHFSQSAQVNAAAPLTRWAQAEAEYLRRVNDDDEYMEVEIGRINLYDSLDAIRRTSIKVFCFGLVVLVMGLTGGIFLIANIGWAVAGVSLVIFVGASIFRQVFATRIPFEILDKER